MSTLIRNAQGLEKNYQYRFLLHNLKSLHVWERSNYKKENYNMWQKGKLKNLSNIDFICYVPSDKSFCDSSNNRATHIIGKKKTLTQAYEIKGGRQ